MISLTRLYNAAFCYLPLRTTGLMRSYERVYKPLTRLILSHARLSKLLGGGYYFLQLDYSNIRHQTPGSGLLSRFKKLTRRFKEF